jgi:hypothetical protein
VFFFSISYVFGVGTARVARIVSRVVYGLRIRLVVDARMPAREGLVRGRLRPGLGLFSVRSVVPPLPGQCLNVHPFSASGDLRGTCCRCML